MAYLSANRASLSKPVRLAVNSVAFPSERINPSSSRNQVASMVLKHCGTETQTTKNTGKHYGNSWGNSISKQNGAWPHFVTFPKRLTSINKGISYCGLNGYH